MNDAPKLQSPIVHAATPLPERHPSADDPYFVSLATVIAASPLLGHALEDRRPIRDAQDLDLARHLYEVSACPLAGPHQRRSFACAPIDILVGDGPMGPEFHLIELNGTGIGGVSNIPGGVVSAIIRSIAEMATYVDDPEALVLLGISGKESDDKPRLNKLMHEKMLFAEALKAGLAARHGHAHIRSVPGVLERPQLLETATGPTVVMGYMKSFLKELELDPSGTLRLWGRRVGGVLNDRFLLNVLNQFGYGVKMDGFVPINRCFLPGGDKAIAYELMNELLQQEPLPYMPAEVPFELAHNRDALVRGVVRWLQEGRQVVIKPHATGVGHGIEFFLDLKTPVSDVIATIDASIRMTEAYYGAVGGAFPYTICQFINARIIDKPDHPLRNHKYELRVVVFRDGDSLHAFPSIVKIASRSYDPLAPDKASLINNVTAATEAGKRGVDFVLPLCDAKNLALLDLDIAAVEALCKGTTRFVRHVLDSMDADPKRFALA